MKVVSKVKLVSVIGVFTTLLSGCSCTQNNKNTIVSFLPTAGSFAAFGDAYVNGINYFISTQEELRFEYENIDESKIKETLRRRDVKAIIGSFNNELNNSVTSNNDIPIITSAHKVVNYEYSSDKAFFPIIPSLSLEAESLGDLIVLGETYTNVGIVLSDEEIYEDMTILLSDKLGEISYTSYKLDDTHNAYNAMLDVILGASHDSLVLLTNTYDFDNLIYTLADKNNTLPVFAPSYINKFFNVPPNYSEYMFSINCPKYKNALNVNVEELNTTFNISIYFQNLDSSIRKNITNNFEFFMDGYLVSSIINETINQSDSKFINTKELTNLLHENKLFSLEVVNE